jgi:hypothetical protein
MCIKTATWTRDSHGLFDYEDQTVQCQTLFARQMEYLARVPSDGNQIQLLTEKEIAARGIENSSMLLKIIPDKDDPKAFAVESCAKTSDYDESNDKLWLVIKSLKRNGIKEVWSLVEDRILS